MFRKVIGDVRHGYVESAWGTFEILGNRKGTLEALRKGAQRTNETPDEIYPRNEGNFIEFNTIHGVGMVAAKYTNQAQSISS